MTDLLSPPFSRAATEPDGGGHRSLSVSALAGGVLAAGAVLALCMAIALAGWFASDAGAHGDTRDALRVGADAWLMAHGAPLALGGGVTVAVLPLGLTAFCVLACVRFGRWAGARSGVADLRTAATGAVLLAGGYAVTAGATALLAFHETAEPHLGRAFLGGLLLAALGGAAGLVQGAGLLPALAERVPAPARSVLVAAASVVLLCFAAGAALVAAALLADFGAAANVLARLHADAPDAFLYTVLVAAFVPNAAALAVAYLIGPGFAVGAGTLVSPSAVVLGPVPAFPLLAALPDDGATAAWTTGLIGLPPLLAAAGVLLASRQRPVPLTTGALRGLAAGVLAGVALAVLVALAGGAAGPGRMAEVGTPFLDVLRAAVVSLAPGGLLGGLVAAWWARRAAPVVDEPTGD